MKYRILTYLFLLVYGISFAQSTEGPEPPVLKYITVNPVYGSVYLEWEASPSPVDSVLGYFIYRHNYIDGLGNPYPNYRVGLVSPSQFQFTDPNSQTRDKQVFYTLASDGPVTRGGFTPPHASIYGTCKYDSCAAEMTLNWTKYQGWNVDTYTIYSSIGNSSDLSAYNPLISVSSSDTSFIQTNIFENQSYNYYIEAVKDGDTSIKSTSKIFSKYTDMPKTPDYITIDTIVNNSLGSSNIDLFFTIDPTSELKDYQISATDAVSVGPTIIHTFTSKTTNFYNDLKSSGYSGPVDYKIDAINTCNQIVPNDEKASNSISLKIENNSTTNSITWDQYKPSSSNTISYQVFRSTNEVFSMIDELIGESEYIDDLKLQELDYNNNSNKFCYYILAKERDVFNTELSSSRSNIKCVYIQPEIHLPNAIAPNADSPDNEFKPILSFNANYLIQIYSRWGNLVFTGENEAWNGTDRSGSLVKNGTYAYFVRITTEDGEKYEYKGSVSVFY